MPYYIYSIIAPNGKRYIGISNNVSSRWASHKRKARVTAHKRHPFYDALRAFGVERFEVHTLETYEDRDAAIRAEKDAIARYRTTDRTQGYNVSRGGEYDFITGGAIFWDRIRNDPEEYREYIRRLSEGCKKRGGINVDALISHNRSLPRREVWKRAHRASRVAKRTEAPKPTQGAKLEDAHVRAMAESLRAVWASKKPSELKRWSHRSRDRALRQWAARSQEEKDEVAGKISKTLADRYSRDEDMKRKNEGQLQEARANIDRGKQGKAASSGLKRFWDELRKDPERYAEYIERRKKSLRETTNAKKNV